jgi:hypothetical protein
MADPITAASIEAPPPERIAPQTLREHIAAEAAEATEAATPPPAATPATPPTEGSPPTPEAEAASVAPDPEISEAARVLRRNSAAARKAQIKSEIDELVRERNLLRSEIAASQRPAEPRTSASPSAPPVAPMAGDLSDPEPSESAFQDYGQYLTAHARWAARDEFRTQQDAVRARIARTQADERAAQHAATLDQQQAAVRERFGDADAVIETVVSAFADNPRAPALAEYLAGTEHGGDIAYRLGKDAALLAKVRSAPSATQVGALLKEIELSITAPKVPHVTKAPAPPKQTVGGGATSATLDTAKGVPLKDHIRIEEAEIAERRRAGYRY